MPDNTDNPTSSAEKVFDVKRSSAGINSIGSASISGQERVISLTGTHNFITGESVRVISDTGQLPDGLTPNTVAFAVTTDQELELETLNLDLQKLLMMLLMPLQILIQQSILTTKVENLKLLESL